MSKTAAICTTCNRTFAEGQHALYDDEGDQHFCNRSCFSEWFLNNSEKLAINYFNRNIEPVDL